MAAKKAALIEALRAERGVAAPVASPVPQPVEQAAIPEQSKAAPAAPAIDPVAKWQAEYMAKQAELAALESRAKAAQAEAAVREAAAAEKLKKLELSAANPVEFLAEVGMTEAEWSEFLTSGGKLTPEQKRVREVEKANQALQAQVKQLMEQTTKSQQEMMARLEAEKFQTKMADFAIVPHVGGVDLVRQKAAELGVSYEQAAKNIEDHWINGLSNVLKDPKVRAKLGLDISAPKPQTESAGQSPSTLNGSVTSPTTGSTASRPAPTDFEAKRKLLIQRLMEAQGSR